MHRLANLPHVLRQLCKAQFFRAIGWQGPRISGWVQNLMCVVSMAAGRKE
jgi:hypothetical protein